MRLLHTADLHLGKVLHEQSLLEDQRHVLAQLHDELVQNSYDVLLIAGDVFDRSVPPPEAVSLWDDFLVRLKGELPRLPLLIIPGNHDSAPRLAYAARFLHSQGIHVRTDPALLDTPITLPCGGVEWDFFVVPWLSGASQRALWEAALERLSAARRPGVPSVLMAHLFTLGGDESDSERVFVGEGEQIPASLLAGWEYVALGHLHRPQRPAPLVRYSGSPLAYSFSEAGTEHSPQTKAFLRVEGEPGALTVTEVPIVPLHGVTRLTSTYDDFLQNPRWQPWTDDYLELTLTDASLVSQPLDRLRTRFPGTLSLTQTARPEGSATSLPAPSARRGSLEEDALAFLADLGPPLEDETREWVARLAREVLHETP